jgi:hypothetical protein
MANPLERYTDLELADLLRQTRRARAYVSPLWREQATQLAQLQRALVAEQRRRRRQRHPTP